jgi:hypothetical protein
LFLVAKSGAQTNINIIERSHRMNTHFIKLFMAIALAFIFVPSIVTAGTVEGTIQGYTCVSTGKVCPIGKEDPLISHEKTFGVYTIENEFYFVPNMDRAILARYINKKVRVVGDINTKYKSVKAQHLEVYKNGEWETPWSLQLEDAIRARIYGPDAKN